jgi:hypothetical protein
MKRGFMKKSSLIVLLVIVTVISLAALSCHNPITPSYSSNKDVINYRDFYLSAENVSLTTMTGGTIFVRGDTEKPEERMVQITAWMEIDPADWGGVSFSIPQGWKVENIASDYPQGNPKPEEYITVIQTAANRTFNKVIHVGTTKLGAPKELGGNGNLIIELAPESGKEELGENFQTIIAVGSKYDYIINPVHETYEVPLNTDYHKLKDR